MLVPKIILPLDDTHANVPANWSRRTDFDGRFPRHSNTGVGGLGGSDTHTHGIQSHSHALNAHTHSVSFGTATASSGTHVNNSPGEGTNDGIATHGHATANSSTTSSANSSSDSFTTGAGSSLPPYYEVIFIESQAYNKIPPNAIMYAVGELDNLVLCDGENGTPDLIDKILRGAGTGQDAGSTGGTTNHTHSLNHGHSSGASHTHTGTSGARSGTDTRRNNQGTNDARANKVHTHTYTTGASTAPINSYSGSSPGDAIIYPPFYTLKPYKNMSGVEQLLEVGAIAMTTEAVLPLGWVLCNGENGAPNLGSNFVKCYATAGETGGSATHTHPSVSHTHTSSNHSHSGTTNGSTNGNTGKNPDGGSNATQGFTNTHTHSLTAANATATYANSNAVFNDGDSIPAYIEVKYIMATNAALGGGGSAMLAFL